MDFQAAIDIIQKNIVDGNFIYVFGSHAQNKNTNNSDLDLAFYSSKEINNLPEYNTAQEIAATFNMDVDLIDLSKAGDTLKMEVIYKGISIFSFFIMI